MLYSGTQGLSVKLLPIYLASAASFPHVPFTLAKLDHKQFLDGSLVIHVFASSCVLLACRRPSPLPAVVTGLVLEGLHCACCPVSSTCPNYSHHSRADWSSPFSYHLKHPCGILHWALCPAENPPWLAFSFRMKFWIRGYCRASRVGSKYSTYCDTSPSAPSLDFQTRSCYVVQLVLKLWCSCLSLVSDGVTSVYCHPDWVLCFMLSYFLYVTWNQVSSYSLCTRWCIVPAWLSGHCSFYLQFNATFSESKLMRMC